MTDSEKAALRQLQDENFRLRVELNHERRCVDDGVAILRTFGRDVACSQMKDAEKIYAVAGIVDRAINALKEPVPK